MMMMMMMNKSKRLVKQKLRNKNEIIGFVRDEQMLEGDDGQHSIV